MMTIKIIVETTNSYPKTYLFTASRIEHYECPLNDGNHPTDTFGSLCQRNNPRFVVTGLDNVDNSQNMHYSSVYLYGDDDDISPMLISAPASIYVTVDGKTIDYYRLGFIE
jgi:hypothetical protein